MAPKRKNSRNERRLSKRNRPGPTPNETGLDGAERSGPTPNETGLDGTARSGPTPNETGLDGTDKSTHSEGRNIEDSGQREEEKPITWHEYFMGIAFLSAKRSKDPNRKVGACIVNKKNRIISTGYNGFPDASTKADEYFPWTKEEKHKYVCHAELNAIVNKNATSLEDCILYSTLFPCNECAKLLIQSRIKHVIYFSDDKADKDAYKASRALFVQADVHTTHYKDLHRRVGVPPLTEIKLEFTPPQDG